MASMWLNDRIIAQLRWCRGRPPRNVNAEAQWYAMVDDVSNAA
ncbi:hypothetical protein [Sphingobium sufflavum]|nr:hypothetical protein [Sphingobium sufflavum]